MDPGALPRTAFVTGGSGFVGGALIRRLAGDGWTVRALARSPAAVDAVEALGAKAVHGDLHNGAALRAGAHGCAFIFHAAAKVGSGGDLAGYLRVNVDGTRRLLAAARDAEARRFVHVGTEAALMAGRPLRAVDETAPLQLGSPVPYSASKARAEAAVLAASETDVFETVSIRPRFVWGAGDTTLLPALVEAARSGRLVWLGGGRHLTETTHIDNAVEGLVLGALRGRPANAYFVTDGPPVVWREFIGELLRTQGVDPPTRSAPAALGRVLLALRQLNRFELWLSTQECTLDDSKAREQLGYAPVTSRADGLATLAGSPRLAS